MIIVDKDYGEFDVNLSDGGTLDTLISVDHSFAGIQDIGYSQEFAANFRDENGAMTDSGFAELAEDAVECYIELYILNTEGI